MRGFLLSRTAIILFCKNSTFCLKTYSIEVLLRHNFFSIPELCYISKISMYAKYALNPSLIFSSAVLQSDSFIGSMYLFLYSPYLPL